MGYSNQLAKKLAAYSLLAGTFIATSKKSEAQIVYTDIIPDDTITFNQIYYLDLNNDDINDFYLTPTDQTFGYFEVAQIGNINYAVPNSVMGLYTGGPPLPYHLQTGDVISGSSPWINIGQTWFAAGDFLLYWGPSDTQNTGFWMDDAAEGLAGLKFKINGETHYGWLRVQVADNASFIILKEYAYDTIPGQGLLAGTSLALGENSIKNIAFDLFPNPSSEKIYITGLNENLNIVEASVLDLSGRKIFSQKISSDQNTIGISSFPEGMYLLQVKNESEVVVKKFQVKR